MSELLKVELSDDAAKVVREIATTTGRSLEQVFTHALELEKFVQEQKRDGAEFVLVDRFKRMFKVPLS